MNATEMVLGSVILEPHTRADELAMFTEQAQIDHWRRRATEAEALQAQCAEALAQIVRARTLAEAQWLAEGVLSDA